MLSDKFRTDRIPSMLPTPVKMPVRITLVWRAFQISCHVGACPSPFGRRWPEGPDEGGHAETLRHRQPSPGLRPPSPGGRGLLSETALEWPISRGVSFSQREKSLEIQPKICHESPASGRRCDAPEV